MDLNQQQNLALVGPVKKKDMTDEELNKKIVVGSRFYDEDMNCFFNVLSTEGKFKYKDYIAVLYDKKLNRLN